MQRADVVGPAFDSDVQHSHAAIGSFYFDEAVHLLEQETVFKNEWLFACHQNELPEVGDYRVQHIGDVSVLVARDQQRRLRAFHNVCQHRGHELTASTEGNTNVFTCPYHAWSYGLDGALRGAPKMRQVPGFCKDDVELSTVGLDIVEGFVFINLDASAAALSDSTPQFGAALRSMIAESESLHLAKTASFTINANWKIVTENFLEAYHVEFSGPAHRALGGLIDTDTYRFRLDGRIIEYTAKGAPLDQMPYEAHDDEAFTSSRGAPFHQLFLYPNMTFSVFPGTNMLFVYVMSPEDPRHTSEQIHYYTLDGELSPPSDQAERYISEQLNREDIALVEAVQRGVQSPGFRPGRFMVDIDQQESWGEQFVHHFISTHLEALGFGDD